MISLIGLSVLVWRRPKDLAGEPPLDNDAPPSGPAQDDKTEFLPRAAMNLGMPPADDEPTVAMDREEFLGRMSTAPAAAESSQTEFIPMDQIVVSLAPLAKANADDVPK
jgi:hypothetical protein